MTAMNASTAKDHLTFTLGNVSYIGPEFDIDARPVVNPEKPGWLAAVMARVAAWRRRREVMAEMAMMSDRELADIGLARSDLPRVFDPAFAADHIRGRDYVGY
jgi:uncharacterized protein YjiS (DUF1127 family)